MEQDRIEKIENDLDVIKSKLEELFEHLGLESINDYDDYDYEDEDEDEGDEICDDCYDDPCACLPEDYDYEDDDDDFEAEDDDEYDNDFSDEELDDDEDVIDGDYEEDSK